MVLSSTYSLPMANPFLTQAFTELKQELKHELMQGVHNLFEEMFAKHQAASQALSAQFARCYEAFDAVIADLENLADSENADINLQESDVNSDDDLVNSTSQATSVIPIMEFQVFAPVYKSISSWLNPLGFQVVQYMPDTSILGCYLKGGIEEILTAHSFPQRISGIGWPVMADLSLVNPIVEITFSEDTYVNSQIFGLIDNRLSHIMDSPIFNQLEDFDLRIERLCRKWRGLQEPAAKWRFENGLVYRFEILETWCLSMMFAFPSSGTPNEALQAIGSLAGLNLYLVLDHCKKLDFLDKIYMKMKFAGFQEFTVSVDNISWVKLDINIWFIGMNNFAFEYAQSLLRAVFHCLLALENPIRVQIVSCPQICHMLHSSFNYMLTEDQFLDLAALWDNNYVFLLCFLGCLEQKWLSFFSFKAMIPCRGDRFAVIISEWDSHFEHIPMEQMMEERPIYAFFCGDIQVIDTLCLLAFLINGFLTPQGDKVAKEQVHGFTEFFSLSFKWSLFQCLYAGGTGCGFIHSLKAWEQSRKAQPKITLRVFMQIFVLALLGPVIDQNFYYAELRLTSPTFSCAMLMTFYKGPIIEMMWSKNLRQTHVMEKNTSIWRIGWDMNLLATAYAGIVTSSISYYVQGLAMKTKGPVFATAFSPLMIIIVAVMGSFILAKKIYLGAFIRECIPLWLTCVRYMLFSTISIIAIPVMFHQLKWYFVLVAYIIAPSLSYCNAYGVGLMDMNIAYNYGIVALFVFAA